jgi:hypothetical protein
LVAEWEEWWGRKVTCHGRVIDSQKAIGCGGKDDGVVGGIDWESGFRARFESKERDGAAMVAVTVESLLQCPRRKLVL